MKKLILLSLIFVVCGFGRTSLKHSIVVSPEYALNNKSPFGIITAADCLDEGSLQWKKRYKRRKKTRRPQRGR